MPKYKVEITLRNIKLVILASVNTWFLNTTSSILRHSVYIRGKTGIYSTESNFHWKQENRIQWEDQPAYYVWLLLLALLLEVKPKLNKMICNMHKCVSKQMGQRILKSLEYKQICALKKNILPVSEETGPMERRNIKRVTKIVFWAFFSPLKTDAYFRQKFCAYPDKFSASLSQFV